MASGSVFTIGHGNHTREGLLQHLSSAAVEFVVDVRSVPYSKYQPEFSSDAVQQALRERRFRYVFMGDLLGGRPKDPDCYTDGRVDYDKVRTKDFFIRGLTRLQSACSQGLRVCLLCSEGQPSQCHRAKLIGVALAEAGIEVVHLLPNGSTRTQSEVIAELTRGQANLFAEHFVSRKTYPKPA